MKMRIAISSDENYVIPLAACLRSIFDNGTPAEDVEIAILSSGISAGSREKLLASWGPGAKSVSWIDVDKSVLADLPTKSRATKHLTSTTYVRLLTPSLLPAEWQRVIFLDTDTLTFAPLAPLWETPLKGHAFAAVRDPYTPVISSDHGIPGWRTLGLDPNAPYFNAGTILMDLALWREKRISEASFAYIRNNRDTIQLADQEAMNAVANGSFRRLDPVWNVMNYWYQPGRGIPGRPDVEMSVREDVVDNAVVRHFNGDDKPWEPGKYFRLQRLRRRCDDEAWAGFRWRHRDYEVYFEYVDRTLWRGWRPPAPDESQLNAPPPVRP